MQPRQRSNSLTSAPINGISVGYDDDGDGKPLVLIHGHPFNRSMWRPQREYFVEAGWRVIVPDLRGYGETTVVAGTTRLDTFARDIAGLLDHLGFEQFVLGGVSMGGQIAMAFHRLFRERLLGLVLVDTSPHAETDAGKKSRNDTADRLLREGMTLFAEEALPKMIAPYNISARPAVARHVLAMMRETSPAGAAAALRGRAERPDYVAMLAQIVVPTLVVVGRDDEFTPVGDAELMHEHIAGSRLVIVDEAGHLPNLEQETVFNAALESFLQSLADPEMRSGE